MACLSILARQHVDFDVLFIRFGKKSCDLDGSFNDFHKPHADSVRMIISFYRLHAGLSPLFDELMAIRIE
jgi:hypothetical protein